MKYQVVLERRVKYLAYIEVEGENFEQAKSTALERAEGSHWREDRTVTEVKTITLVPS